MIHSYNIKRKPKKNKHHLKEQVIVETILKCSLEGGGGGGGGAV